MKNLKERFLPKYIKNYNVVKRLLVVVIAASFLGNCSTYRINRLKHKSYKKWKSYQWNETKRSSDKEVAAWAIFSRKLQGTNLLEYKIEGVIASTPISCIVAFRNDIYQQADKLHKKYPVYEIIRESEDSLMTYLVHNEPFPFKDTEMCVRYWFFNNEDGSTAVKWKEAWGTSPVPVSKRLNRVEIFRGSWQFSTVSENQTIAVNKVQFDPKGMPKWLINPMATKFLREGLETLRHNTSR